MSYKKYFRRIIHQVCPETGSSILRETDKHYLHILKDIDFSFTSKNPLDKRLDFTAFFLALIKSMNERGLADAEIRDICLKITYEYVRPKNAFHRWLKHLPPILLKTRISVPLLKWMGEKVNQNGHPDGFRAHVITAKEETFGFGYGVDILECGICKLFSKHKASKYSSILCEVDKITSGFAGLELVRKGTIANGSHKCDFRFKRIA